MRKNRDQTLARAAGAVQTAEIKVSHRLRELRLDKRLTLQELAKKVAISSAYLSRVENHKVSITIAGLERLAHALGVSMNAFFEEEDESPPIVLCRSGKGRIGYFRGPKGFSFEMLATGRRGKLMEPLLVDIAAARQRMALTSHPGEEFNYVLEGECDFIYGKETNRLKKGDSVYYDATVPHACCAIPRRPALLLVVVASKDYLFHGDLSTLLKGRR